MTAPTVTAELDFDKAAHLVLTYLSSQLPLALWSVTRVENGQQTFLYLNEGNDYGITYGDHTPWQDSFCIHMAAGTTPTVSAIPSEIPEYAHAAEINDMQVGTYAGAVIDEPNGNLFGTICGIDKSHRLDDDTVATAIPLLQFMGRVLTLVLAADRYREQVADGLTLATAAAETDALTGLMNRRAWDRTVLEEEERFRRLADPTITAVIDLDGLKRVNDEGGHAAGDDLIRTAGRALRAAVRGSDVVARLGGDEFAVLMRQCDLHAADSVIANIERAFTAAGVEASIGWAAVTVSQGLTAAVDAADRAMYEQKAARRKANPA